MKAKSKSNSEKKQSFAKSFFKKVIITCFIFIVICIFVSIGVAGYFYYVWSSNLPYIGNLKDYRPPVITEVYSDNGEIIGRFWEEKRILVDMKVLPEYLVQAFISAEDSRFFEHRGIDILGIIRAMTVNVKAGKFVQGGSTITQQVAKSLLLKNPEKTYRRKVREAMLSMQMEKELSKEHILYIYLNEIFLGHGAYGVEVAALNYFGKSAKDISLAEAALIAGLPQAPSRYSPVRNFASAKARQLYVLGRMRDNNYITKAQYNEAASEAITIIPDPDTKVFFEKTPYFTEHIRRDLLDRYGANVLYRDGLKVYTTVNVDMQRAARAAILEGTLNLDKREGYRGPVAHLGEKDIDGFSPDWIKTINPEDLSEGMVLQGVVVKVSDADNESHVRLGPVLVKLPFDTMKWARKPNKNKEYIYDRITKPSSALTKGDVILVKLVNKDEKGPFSWIVSLAQEPVVQSALICFDLSTGAVKAMVGGRDYEKSQFNRVIQSKRQPGSAFKPLIYAAALDKGLSPAKVILDAPLVAPSGDDDEVWKPRNYGRKFNGPTILRTGLALSLNVITVKLLQEIGIPYTIDYIHKLGIFSHLDPNLSLALGSSEVPLYDITKAYSVFAKGGYLIEPIFINRIFDRDGRVIEEHHPNATKVISEQTAYVMTDLLKAVINEGTGARIKALKRPVAGKTGTTNNLIDAWFLGYTPEFVTGVWVGYDQATSMGEGETGARAASPIWLKFMSEILEDYPIEDFDIPPGIIFAAIDGKTGLLAASYSEKTYLQAFREGEEPTKQTPAPMQGNPGEFFMFDMND